MTLKVSILDMQPIEPPTGGGRLRLLGLHHALGEEIAALYVGTYDWRGPGHRRQLLSPTLEELMVPLSAEHFSAADDLSRAAGGRVVIDCTFPQLAHLSPQYVSAAREAAGSADVVVFSHPWIYPLVRDVLDRTRQLIVYDAHNVEGILRMELLDDGGTGTEIVRAVIAVEYELCHIAHLVLACSHEDRVAFNRFYSMPHERIRVIPNGTFTAKITPASASERSSARDRLGVGSAPIAFFIGSNYEPNVRAARYIADSLAPAHPLVLFAIIGGVSESLARMPLPLNMRLAGLISDEQRQDWLHAADLAINPMFGGSGTNIKMLDFMAAGLPIVTTPIGARGIETSRNAFLVAEPSDFAHGMDRLLADVRLRRELGEAAREQALKFYSWERISRDLGGLLRRHAHTIAAKRPFFSVVIPSYERHAQLTLLVERLAQQSWQDFEVIIVDQSAMEWPDRNRTFRVDLLYVHTDLRGPGFARNAGARLARGPVIAFIDDDCDPSVGWLAAAQAEFAAHDIVGLEGLIVSGRNDDPEWRAVTNEGFEGLGFMTANLFIREETFHSINGFDVAFGDVPFREDTDLGWRALKLGRIPFSRAARVYHPPQPRALERESFAARALFFEKDALLLSKHPKKYVDLMRCERQWKYNPHFWTYFLRGVRRYNVEIPDEIRDLIPAAMRKQLRVLARSDASQFELAND